MTTTAETLRLAGEHHQAGNLAQAETLYRQVLQAEPHSPHVLYLLGRICQARGRLEESVTLFQQSLRLKPDSAEACNSLGVTYASLGRRNEAMACCREAVRLKPYSAEAYQNLGFLHGAQGDWDQAAAAYRQALVLQPRYAEAWNGLGIVHCQQQRPDEAVRCFKEALALQPSSTQALNNLGNAFLYQDKLVEAGDCYRQVLRLLPNDAGACNNLAAVHTKLGQHDEAAACLRLSLAHNPNNLAALRNLGNACYWRGNNAEALDCYRRLLSLCPSDAQVRMLVDALSGAKLSRLPADYLIAHYDGVATRWDQEIVARLGYRSPELLQEALGPAPPPRSLDVLDLGCGTGLCGLRFRDWARTLTGVDQSSHMLAKARERGGYDELIQGDLLIPLQEREEAFDLILASDVLLYLGDLEPVYQGVARALRPGGNFAFTVDVHEESDYRLMPPIHFAHSRTYLQNLAAKTRLREVTVNPVVFPREGGQAAGLVVVLSRDGTTA